MVDQLLHGVEAQQFGGVRGYGAGSQDVHAGGAVRLHHVFEARFTDQHGGQTHGAFELQVVGHLGTPQVGIDHQDAFTGGGQGGGDVDGAGGLAFVGDGRGDHDGALAILKAEELQVGA